MYIFLNEPYVNSDVLCRYKKMMKKDIELPDTKAAKDAVMNIHNSKTGREVSVGRPYWNLQIDIYIIVV